MPTIGTDCHITLQHDSVNGGDPAGFILWRPDALGGEVEVTRTGFILPTGDMDTAVKYVLPIVTADNLLNPNGAKRGAVRSAEYALYLAYVAAGSGITLAIPGHTFAGLYAVGASKEKHYASRDELTLVLTNGRVARDLPPGSHQAVRDDGDITLTSAWADVADLVLWVVLPGTGYSMWLNGTVRFPDGPQEAWAQLLCDGVAVASTRVENLLPGAVDRALMLSARVTNAAPGPHTFKAQMKYTTVLSTAPVLEGGDPGSDVARFSAINW